MSDLLNQASLVMVPSGYKEDTVYSVVPSDGSGDLSFTRASNGTRINSAGLVEVTPWNLNTNSENFTSGWGTDGTSTATNNFTTAPNGTTTAAKVVANSAGGYAYKTLSGSPNVYTLSLYVKASANTTIDLAINDVGGSGIGSQNFNVTTEWQRIEYDQNVTNGSSVIMVYGAMNTGVDYYIWGAQLNIGSTAKPYFPTTDRLNVPRLTYQNGGGGCPSLLLEKQSTNQFTYSEQFDNGAWTKSNTTVTANSAISPDGTQNADTVANTGTNNTPELFQLYSGASSSTAYTFTCYMKSNTHTKGVMRGYNGGSTTTPLVLFDLSAGTVIASYGDATNPTITSVGNGWYRCSMTFTTISATVGIYGHITNLSNTYTYQSSFNYVENYNNTGSIYIWGAQLEASSYATSLINTTSASATRVADACYKTGISSLIGQTEGTLFVDFVFTAYDSQAKWIAFLGGGSYYIGLYTDGSSHFVAEVYDNAFSFLNQTFTFSVGTRYKLALAYKTNDFAFYVNGTQVATDNSGTVPATSQFSFEYNSTANNNTSRIYNQAILFKTRLTNAELASITSL